MFLKRVLAIVGLVVGLSSVSHAKSSTGDSVLVLLEPSLKKENYSTFFNGLTEGGYELTFRAPRDLKPTIIEDDVAQFAHVIVFAPDTKSTCSRCIRLLPSLDGTGPPENQAALLSSLCYMRSFQKCRHTI